MEAKRRRQWIVLAALVLVAVVLGAVRMVQQIPSRATASNTPVAANESESATELPSVPTAVDVTWPRELKRDLFAWEAVFEVEQPQEEEPVAEAPVERPDPAAVRRDAEREVALQAIIFGEEPIAMINGEVTKVGQTVAGFRVVRIEARRIVLEKENIEISLEL